MTPQQNTWVNNLLSLYQHSRTGNSENRGLTSEFARQTYIETRLDTNLLPAVINGQYQVVFLTGNPGDGKTAFLEKVFEQLNNSGAVIPHKDSAGWQVTHNQHTYTACYDASESSQGQSADARLRQLFQPFRGDTAPSNQQVVLVAINDGKLHSFFHLPEVNQEFHWLAKTVLEKAFQGFQRPDDRVVIVNLKERTLIDLELDIDNAENSLFDKLLWQFSEKSHWQICDTCSSQPHCPIWVNAKSFGWSDQAKQVRTRLKTLFTISHLRRQRHNTMRDIRSALAFVITSNLDCQAVHDGDPKELQTYRYFNAIFERAKDDALQEFSELDPARMGVAQLDRQLNVRFHQQQTPALITALLPNSVEVEEESRSEDDDAESWITHMRRQLFFEGREDRFATKLRGVTEVWELLPYRHFETFLNYLRHQDPTALRRKICRGISQTEGIPEVDIDGSHSKSHLLIRVTENVKEGLIVCKKLPADEFDVFIPNRDQPFLENLPERMVFKHRPTGIQCVLTLDIFEILLRMAEGQLPVSREQVAVLDELNDFKSRLHRYQTKDLLLLETNGQVHHVTQRQGKIIRQQREEGVTI